MNQPWGVTRSWPTEWTENSMQARGLVMEPEQAIASLLAWSAVVVVGSAAVVAGGLLAAAKFFGGDR